MTQKTNIKKVFPLLLTILLFSSCQKENEIPTEQEGQQKIHRITLEEMEQNIGKSKAYAEIEKMLNYENRGIVDIELQTDEIVLIEGNGYIHYTLKLINNDPNEDNNIFYNLVFDENTVTGEVKSNIFKYTPEPNWLSDTSQPYEGNIDIVPNDYFTIGDIGRALGRCVTGVTFGWECDAGNPHDPDQCGTPTCSACGSEYFITIQWGPCPEVIDAGPGGGGGGTGGNNGGGGGTTGGNNTETIVLVPCTSNGGFGGPNGESCTPVEDLFAPFLCQPLNQQQQNWIFANTENTAKAERLLTYLQDTQPNSCVTIDFEEEIIMNEPFENNPKMSCAYQRVKEAGGLRQLIDNFFTETNTGILEFEIVQNLSCNNGDPNGCTKATKINGTLNAVKIQIDADYINNTEFAGAPYQTPMLYLARTLIHESLHANLYFAVNQLTNGSNNLPDDSEFEPLYESYRLLKGWQHEFMADHYLNIIAQGLENVHPLIGDQTFINNHSYYDWDDFYQNLAWVGLQGTDAFDDYNDDYQNFNDFQLYNIDALVDSTKNQNCQ